MMSIRIAAANDQGQPDVAGEDVVVGIPDRQILDHGHDAHRRCHAAPITHAKPNCRAASRSAAPYPLVTETG